MFYKCSCWKGTTSSTSTTSTGFMRNCYVNIETPYVFLTPVAAWSSWGVSLLVSFNGEVWDKQLFGDGLLESGCINVPQWNPPKRTTPQKTVAFSCYVLGLVWFFNTAFLTWSFLIQWNLLFIIVDFSCCSSISFPILVFPVILMRYRNLHGNLSRRLYFFRNTGRMCPL